MKRFTKALAFLAFLMLGAVNAVAGERVPLTTDMFFAWDGWGADAQKTGPADCTYVIGESTGQPYGDSQVINYADLSLYSKLIVTCTEGTPRFLFNRDMDEGQWNENEAESHLIDNTRNGWSARYFSQDGETYVVDLKLMVKEKGFAHLHAIKGANWANVTVTSMELEREGKAQVVGWTDLITNGDLEGDDVSCFYSKENASAPFPSVITDGIGVDGSRGIMVHSAAGAAQDWDAQFWINLPEILKKIASFRNGIIFVTGTTGSGKSTTMAAMLDYINNTSEQHVITIEDPIEYTFQDNRSFFEQREIGLDAASFDSALIHALRQDPDIIMVGEMRNRETFETALAAAETGHMVLTTLHTKDAAQSISRILDMFPLEERDSIRKSISECLQAIVCQRLAPRAIGQGVVPINEILINTSIVKKLIFDNQLEKVPQAIAGGEEEGMMSFNQCLLKLAKNGDITEETALKFSDTPQQLQMNLKGIFLSSGGIIQ